MNTFLRFLYEFVNQFISGLLSIVNGVINGIKQFFNFPAYYNVISEYKNDFTGPEWVLTAITVLFMVVFYGLIIFLITFIVKKYLKLRKPSVEKKALIDEVAELNKQVVKLSKEKDEILKMKVSQLGLKPDESPIEDAKALEGAEDDGAIGENGIKTGAWNLFITSLKKNMLGCLIIMQRKIGRDSNIFANG